MEKEDIILLSTAEWDNPFWTNKQHVAVQLAKRGHRVLYIDSLGLRKPSASKQDLGRIWRRIGKAFCFPFEAQPNLRVWSPLVLPFQSHSLIRRINKLLINLSLSFILKCLGMNKDFLWTYNPLTTQVIHYQQYKKVIYHCVDEIKAQPGMPVSLLESAERELVSRADIVFVTAPKLLETRGKWNPNTHYLPNVADYDHFSKAMEPTTTIPENIAQIPSPRIGFIGAISGYKIDFDLIRFVAQSRPDWSIVLIGKVGEGDPWTNPSTISGISNIYFLGPRSYADLPKYLKAFDVALLPNSLNEYTESMFPMKFFEYLAAGKIVVSVDLPSLQEFKDNVLIAKTSAEFVKQIETALDGKGPSLAERLKLAREYTYETRTAKMMQLLVLSSQS